MRSRVKVRLACWVEVHSPETRTIVSGHTSMSDGGPSAGAEGSFSSWLTVVRESAPTAKYRHRRLDEVSASRNAAMPGLRAYAIRAHQPALRELAKLLADQLVPNGVKGGADGGLKSGYPYKLHSLTLQGYLGELLTGLVAERFGACGVGEWTVLAFSFVDHELAFNSLDRWRRSGVEPTTIPGHFGDDVLAFVRDEKGLITMVLVAEAKCTLNHSAELIASAHEQLSDRSVAPVSLWKIVQIVERQTDPTVKEWLPALKRLFLRGDAESVRSDLLVYVCGQRPERGSTWISETTPHAKYLGGRALHVTEIHLDDVAALITQLYRDEAEWEPLVTAANG